MNPFNLSFPSSPTGPVVAAVVYAATLTFLALGFPAVPTPASAAAAAVPAILVGGLVHHVVAALHRRWEVRRAATEAEEAARRERIRQLLAP
ncbi:hypothetical protein DVS28_b0108 (plasmid) [Euzebya pacifica]|uniref:Uncharacterized protein n=1 Tax=Euzebya pacifica TaxID=1608957 RepID=A0A346Y5Y1_9ACTN|nr:hypothetical protein [Euzebya pacifica]AXV09878.1 hypothetical protein DVS28_b0108 [Euzebya pacifica]